MKNIVRIIAVMLVGLIPLATTSACRSKGPAVPVSQPAALERSKAQVNLLTRGLERRVASELQEHETLPDGRMRAAVNLRNRTRSQLHLQVRTVFKDSRGISTGDETAWENLYLEPRQSATWRAESKSTNADIFTMEVRRP